MENLTNIFAQMESVQPNFPTELKHRICSYFYSKGKTNDTCDSLEMELSKFFQDYVNDDEPQVSVFCDKISPYGITLLLFDKERFYEKVTLYFKILSHIKNIPYHNLHKLRYNNFKNIPICLHNKKVIERKLWDYGALIFNFLVSNDEERLLRFEAITLYLENYHNWTNNLYDDFKNYYLGYFGEGEEAKLEFTKKYVEDNLGETSILNCVNYKKLKSEIFKNIYAEIKGHYFQINPETY